MKVQLALLQACVATSLLLHTHTAAFNTNLNHDQPEELRPLFWSSTLWSNCSGPQCNTTDSVALLKGFSALAVSVFGFGSCLVPIKHTQTGDGMFFQFVFCSALLLGAVPVHIIQGCPRFWLPSMLGGMLFGTGNLTSIPIIRTIGLGMGSLIWSVLCLLMGWASARFGWFWLDQQNVPNLTLNYIGTALATVSALILFFIKPESERKQTLREDTEPLLSTDSIYNVEESLIVPHNDQADSPDSDQDVLKNRSGQIWKVRLSPFQKQLIGCTLSVVAGILYGCCYDPITYIKNDSLRNNSRYKGASQYDLDYIFPFMLGMYIVTAVVFFVYCVIMKNRPHLPAGCVLPAMLGGSIQCVGQITWLIACYFLGSIVTFPIGTAGPALVSLIWSVFCFKEIKGTKNFILLTAVLITILTGVVLITVSKIK